MSFKKLVMMNESLREFLAEEHPTWLHSSQQHLDIEKFHQYRDQLAGIYRSIDFHPQEVIDASTLDELFAMKPDADKFVRWLKCARAWDRSVACANLTRIESIQDRLCTTLFYEGSRIHDYYNKRHLFNTSDTSFNSYFDAKEVVKLVVDFEPEDYADLKRQIGARLIFHDNNHVASMNEFDFFITRGYRYDFHIEREDTTLLGYPYSNCLNYRQIYEHEFRSKINPRVPLTVDTCFQNCVVMNVVRREYCWPSTMPFFHNDTILSGDKIKACSAFGETKKLASFNETARLESLIQEMASSGNKTIPNVLSSSRSRIRSQQRSYMKIRRYCWSRCIIPCRKPNFSISVSRSAWPADAKALVDKTGQDQLMHHCCALITVKFNHFHYTTKEYVPKYSIVDTVGNIGGLLAVWMGISIVSIYRGLQKCAELCNQHSLSRVNVDSSS